MSESNNLKYLLIDDEKECLSELSLAIKNSTESPQIITELTGDVGWERILEAKPDIVFCDLKSPGYSAIELVKKIRSTKKLSHIYFIVILQDNSRKEKFKAIEEGIDDFILKPISSDELYPKLKIAQKFVALHRDLKESNELVFDLSSELEKSFADLTMLGRKIIETRFPESKSVIESVVETSIWIAKQLGEFTDEEMLDLEMAANLCYVGKMFLPDSQIKKPISINGEPATSLMGQVPIIARDVLQDISRFKYVTKIVYHIFENFDGSGFPQRLQSWQIPMASRIIRVALDFEELMKLSRQGVNQVIEVMKLTGRRFYDHRIVTLLEQYQAFRQISEDYSKEKAIRIDELTDGMVVTRDIMTNFGIKLVPPGVRLDKKIIRSILMHNQSDPVLGYIFIEAN
ncbi:MAG: response regulator [Candidatus Kapabacteria bacterium]|nr:response regulator [Candidatus Kapabacteria bacterium]